MAWLTRTELKRWGLALVGAALAAGVGAGGCDARPRAPERGCVAVSRPGLIAASAGGRIAFDSGVEQVTLAPACGAALADKVRAAEGRRFVLLVDDLRAQQPPGAVYTLRLAESGGDTLRGEDAVLGALNFFNATPQGSPGPHRSVSYDVTRTVRALAASGRLGRSLVLMLAPSEPPSPSAQLSVGRIQLVAQ